MIQKVVMIGVVFACSASALLFLPGAADDRKMSAPGAAPGAAVAGGNPARLLDCDLGRITNFDPSRDQRPSDYRFEGHHVFRLFLPPSPARTGPPPSALATPDPVDPRTRILADPDGLSSGTAGRPFFRVVDFWPARVEMATPITATASTLIVLDGFDPLRNTVNLFTTAAADGMTFDRDRLFAGVCKVAIGAALPPDARR
jgi:hypothetical protein